MNSLVFSKKDRSNLLSATDHLFESVFNDIISNTFSHTNGVNAKKSSYPKLDIYEEEDEILIEAAVPGLKKENIEVNWDNDVLTITGSSSVNNERKLDNYLTKQLHKSSFTKVVQVQKDHYEVDKIEADLDLGILTIRIPKKNKKVEKANSKKISITERKVT